MSGLLALIPFLVLSFAYLYLAYEHRNINLLYEVIHENGKYTLLETIFYFNHFLREIVICLTMSFAFSLSFYMNLPLARLKGNLFLKNVRKFSLLIVLLLLVFVIFGAVLKSSLHVTALDLFQFKTTNDLISYGSHWNFHLLHTVFMFLFAISFSFIYRAFGGASSRRPNKPSLFYIWIVVFISLTIVFIPDKKSFVDVRYLAHEFREIITHSLVTMPLSFSFLIYLESKIVDKRDQVDLYMLKKGLLFLFLSLLIPLFIVFQLSSVDVLFYAQKQSNIPDLFTSHFFEHFIDYLFVPLLSGLFFTHFVLSFRNPSPAIEIKFPTVKE